MLRKELKEKITLIEKLRHGGDEDECDRYDIDDEVVKGKCTRAKLKHRVFKKIGEVNQYVRDIVEPEIHEKYAEEIQMMLKKHSLRIDQMTHDHRVEVANFETKY